MKKEWVKGKGIMVTRIKIGKRRWRIAEIYISKGVEKNMEKVRN